MWVRKRIDVSWYDLGWALVQCALPASYRQLLRKFAQFSKDNLWVTLSIRSGFDLIWRVLNFERDSEVIFTGFTIPDMPKIVVEHGLRPIVSDLHLDEMGPAIGELRSKITPRTRAIVVAHLWGGRVDLSQVAELAKKHDLYLIEDCAQAYGEIGNWGDSRADISMFSFGSIKTNSALGGAVFRVKDNELAQNLNHQQLQQPFQSRFSYFRRLLKYSFVKLISTRIIAGAVCRAFSLFGANHDRFAATLAKGFHGKNYFKRIRLRPSVPLLKLLHRKLSRFDAAQVTVRQRRGEFLAKQISSTQVPVQQDGRKDAGHAVVEGELARSSAPLIVGEHMLRQTYWVFAVLVEYPEKLVKQLWKAGFDATHQASLKAITVEKRGKNSLSTCELIQNHIVYLPFDLVMPASEVERMIDVIRNSGARCPDVWLAINRAKYACDFSPLTMREDEIAKL